MIFCCIIIIHILLWIWLLVVFQSYAHSSEDIVCVSIFC